MDSTSPARALRALCGAVRPHPKIAATHVTCLWENGQMDISHYDEAMSYSSGRQSKLPTDPTPSAHTRMIEGADIARMRPFFEAWVASIAAHPAYAHAAHRIGIRIGYDGVCHLLLDGWNHHSTTPHTGDVWAERLETGAAHISDGTLYGCFLHNGFEGTAHLHPRTISALGDEQENGWRATMSAHPWRATVAPLRRPQDYYAYLNTEDCKRVHGLMERINKAVQSWKGRAMQPIMDVYVKDIGAGPVVLLHHILADKRSIQLCTVEEWRATQDGPPTGWETNVLAHWSALWDHLRRDAPILDHCSDKHPREGRFTPAHTTQAMGTLTLWRQHVGNGERLLLARGIPPGPLHMAASGDGGFGVPIHSADIRRIPRLVRGLVAGGKNRPVHIFGPSAETV